MTAREKFLKLAEKSLSKWVSINLSNCAKELSSEELKELIPVVQVMEISRREKRLETLTGLSAPEVILDNERKLLAKARVECQQAAILRRTLTNRRSKT